MPTTYIANTDHYSTVLDMAMKAKKTLWIGTADIKDLYVLQGKAEKPFLGVLAELLGKGVEIRPYYQFEESCQGTVPEAIIAFLDSSDFENAVRLAVSLGGDSDTLACITGGIAEAYYKQIPEEIVREMWQRLPECFRQILKEMQSKFRYPLPVRE